MSILAYFMTAGENKTEKVVHSSNTLNDDDTCKEEEDIDQAKGLANNVGDEEWKPSEEAHGRALCANFVAQPVRQVAIGGTNLNGKGRQNSGQGKCGTDHQVKEPTEGLAR